MSRPADKRIDRISPALPSPVRSLPANILAAAATLILVSGGSAQSAEPLAIAIDRPQHLAISPDGGRAAVANDRTAIVVETDTGREVDRLTGECCITGLAWVGGDDILIPRSSGDLQAGGHQSGSLQLYRPGIYQPPSKLADQGCSAVSAASALAVAACGDGLILVGVEDGAGSVVAYGGLGVFHDLAVTPDGSMVIAAHRAIDGAAGAVPLAGDPATALFLDVAVDWPVDPPAAYGEMVLEADIRHLAPVAGGAVATLADGSVARLSTDGLTVIHESVMPPGGEPLVVLPGGDRAIGGFEGGPVLNLETGAQSAGPFSGAALGTGVWAVSAGPVSEEYSSPVVAWAGPGPDPGQAALRVWRDVSFD